MKKKFDRDEDYDEDGPDGMGFCYAILIAIAAFGIASWYFG